jgi:hypothetical protein
MRFMGLPKKMAHLDLPACILAGISPDVPWPYEILDQIADQVPVFPGSWQDKPGESRCNSERMLNACQEV